jgi:hypothetical protein
MASFAKLNSDNIVERVIAVNNNELLENGIESENKGISFLKETFGKNTIWKQTSYNTFANTHKLGGTPFRKNHAGVGFIYDINRDAFIAPKPFDSWILNENTCIWESPIAYPNDGKKYLWNETNKTWDLINEY